MSCRQRAPASAAGPGPRVPGCRPWTHLAARAGFAPATVTRYGKTTTVHAAAITCLWYGVFGSRPVQVILIRDASATGYDLALVTTDLNAGPAHVIERYAARWSIEVAIEDSKQIFGAGQARNRTARAVRRTIPFQLACQALAMTWYATAGHDPADISEHRNRAPWYTTKTQPSTGPDQRPYYYEADIDALLHGEGARMNLAETLGKEASQLSPRTERLVNQRQTPRGVRGPVSH